MSFFKEVKQQKQLDDTTEIVDDFRRQVPFWSYRASNYRILESYQELTDQLDECLEKLFKGEIDDGNADVLDNIIVDSARLALMNLSTQRKEHEDSIKNLYIQAVGAKDRMKSHIDSVDQRIEIVNAQLTKLRSKYENNRFEKGDVNA